MFGFHHVIFDFLYQMGNFDMIDSSEFQMEIVQLQRKFSNYQLISHLDWTLLISKTCQILFDSILSNPIQDNKKIEMLWKCLLSRRP